jgi:hypothetical protein
MASSTPAASGRGTNIAVPEDSLVLTEPYYICILFIYLYCPFAAQKVPKLNFRGGLRFRATGL